MDTKLLEKIESPQIKKVPDVQSGDLVRVHQKIKEGKKERIQVFEGVVLRVRGGGLRKSFIVRKISFGIGVERCFLIHSPNIEKIEVKKRAKVRRAYLTYLRSLTGKKARLKDKQFDSLIVNVQPEPEVDEAQEVEKKPKEEKTEETIDAEITELDAEKVGSAEIEEVPLEEVEKEEIKAAEAEDEIKEGLDEDDHQKMEIEAAEEGIEEAEKELKAGKETKPDRSEKETEDTKTEDIIEEIEEEKK